MAKANDEQEKTSFVLYTQYMEQFDSLTDVQAGQLIKAIMHYVADGDAQVADPVVAAMLMFIRQQLNIDQKRWEESRKKRREAGSKGGKTTAERRQQEKQAEANDSNAENAAAFQAVNVNENVNVNANEYVNVNENVNDFNITLCSNSSRGRNADEADEHTLVFYGANQRPTTSAQLRRSEALTDELYSTYMHNKPTRYDYECIFERVHERAVNADGEAYAAYSPVKADLLRYVFKTAAEQQKTGWYYMDGILKKCEENGITTAEEALQHEYRWKRGEIA
ncbi:MAG: hypothetical protein E7195_05550 [Peptococcaceae bacterium]|nr:hypothetical protein [Peptococcaceae bacterium]